MSGAGRAPRSLPALAAGERIYVIGRQDGTFPPSGWHLPGEMGGIWAHPRRLAAGFALFLASEGGRGRPWHASAYRQGRLCARYRGAGPDGLAVDRRDCAADDKPVLWVRLRLRAPAAGARIRLRLEISPHLREVWPAPAPSAPQEGPVPATVAGIATQVWTRAGTGAVAVAVAGTGSLGFAGDESRGRWRAAVDLEPGQRVDLHLLVAGGLDARDATGALGRFWAKRGGAIRARAHRERGADRSGRVRMPGEPHTSAALADLGRSTRWLVRTVPDVGRGMAAGMADYPWWFGCDGAYIALGLLGAGQPELARDTLEVVARAGARSPRWPMIPHEVTTQGQVVHAGNPVETAHWAWAACHYVRMTGDLAFARRHYPAMRAGLRALLATGALPSGFGIMEIEGLNQRLVDTAAYTWAALSGLAGIATDLALPDEASALGRDAETVRRAVEDGLWLEEPGLYADWRATRPSDDAARGMRAYARRLGGARAEARLARALAAMPEAEAPSRPFGNWVTLTPLAVALAAPERATRVLSALRRSPALVSSGLCLSESVREHPMTISTLVGAAAAARYGDVDLAMRLIRAVTGATGRLVPRAVSEFLPEGGCFVQGWTLYARWVLLTDLLGLEVDAVHRRLVVRPAAPPPVAIAIDDFPVGGARLAISGAPDAVALRIDQPGWTARMPAGGAQALVPGQWLKRTLDRT